MSFFWTTVHLFVKTLLISVILLTIYFVIDTVLFKKEGSPVPADAAGSKEKLGFEGREEGVSAYATVLLTKEG